jgi:hypothetical protein
MGIDDTFSVLKEVASVIRLGSGLLGKSAIVIGLFIVCLGIAILRLHDDRYIFGALVFGAIVFFAWFIPIIKFADRHPDAALLEGAQWAQHQRDRLSAKNFNPTAGDLIITSIPELQCLADSNLAAEDSAPRPERFDG